MRGISFPGRRTLIASITIILLILFKLPYVAIAAAIIFIISLFIFPAKRIKDFFTGVLPTIDALSSYIQSIIYFVNQEQVASDYLLQEQKNVIKTLVPSSSSYPEWVYKVGFNPGLRSSFRYFLIQVERVADTCFSLGYWLTREQAAVNDAELKQLISNAMTTNITLLSIIGRYLYHQADKTLQPLLDTHVDYVNDINLLEDAVKRETPGSLELLDMSAGYVYLTAIVRDVKDLRNVLLQLVASLPAKA